MNVQLVTVELLKLLYIPPPTLWAMFPMNVQLVTVGLLPSMYIPPPRLSAPQQGPLALPPVIVNPSRTVSDSSPVTHCTPCRLPVPSMTVFVTTIRSSGSGCDDDLVRVHSVVDGGLDRAVRVQLRPIARSWAVVVIYEQDIGLDAA